MTSSKKSNSPTPSAIPSVDKILGWPAIKAMSETHGRHAVTEVVRGVLADFRDHLTRADDGNDDILDADTITERTNQALYELMRPSLIPVFNLTGTIIHTNLGRAPLPVEAIDAMTQAAGAANLEYDLGKGRRGDRDSHLEDLICRLTGAEAATVVNNNAAAVLLSLNTLANRRSVPVSRGELVEIGGAFRIPDIMKRAGCRLVEVGTTNRTHAKDYEGAIEKGTALLMKVHASNYSVEGFTKAVSETEVAAIAHAHDLPFLVDLGSGTLVDFRRFGLPYEPTPEDTLKQGADVVTFSGDKLLGGPQAGIIVGTADLIAKIKRNPMKRAMRLDKVTIAALEAVLRLYLDPDRLAQRLPVLRLLTRPVEDIREQAARVLPVLEDKLNPIATVEVIDCQSQIGSGSLPIERLPSAGIAIRPNAGKRGANKALKALTAAFASLPTPVIGRVHDGAFIIDLRCLDDEDAFVQQVANMAEAPGTPS